MGEVASDLNAAVFRRLNRGVMAANAAAAVVVTAYTMLLPSGARVHGSTMQHNLISAALLVVYLGIALPSGSAVGARMTKRGCAYLDEGREPTDEERRLLLRAPGAVALLSLSFWIGAAVIFGALNLAFDHSGYQTARTLVSCTLGGLVTAALVFFLVERILQPLFADALGGEAPERPVTIGIRPRLLLAWALGSGVPLLGILLAPVGLRHSSWHLVVLPMAVLGFIGLCTGGLLLWSAARAIADPLEAVRLGLARLERGELDVEVTVDDGGEIGMLQSGFNHTVAGLRQRRRLEELFGRHVGAEVAAKAVDRGVALGGERAEASMLFVDLAGSTAFANSHAPETVVAALNAFFSVVVRAVHAEGGWVNKFEGDAALCVFGVPAGPDDHAARALRAARTLRQELLALAATMPGVDAGIGVSAGAVVAGNIGAEERYEYTVIGAPVNEASRLTEQAKLRLGRVLASEDVVQRAGDEATNWAVADELHLRGVTLPVMAFEPRLQPVDERTTPSVSA
jgi:adenylate cyclase